MKLRNRLFLVGFGILLFAIATPILVLFTSGYQIDWENKRFVKTGVLVVRTLPSKAEIYLDNKRVAGVTPETVRFIKPGDYNVRLEKEGYQSWTKRLPIYQQFATWANHDQEYVTLFYTSPKDEKHEQTNFSQISKTAEEIAYVQGDTLHSYNTSNGEIRDIGSIGNFSVPFTFSSNLIWQDASQTFDFFQRHTTPVNLAASQIKKVVANGEYMAALAGGSLYTINNSAPVVIDRAVTDAYLDGEDLWYITGNILKHYNLRLKSTDILYDKLPQATNTQIIRGDGTVFFILDNALFILNDQLERIYDGVNFANFDRSSGKLLFANQNQILVYDPERKSSELILSSISPVANPVLNSHTGYVFFSNENKIKAIELDGRDHRNIYTIADIAEPNSQFIVSNDGSLLTIFSNASLRSFRIR